ncbi:hypothetical protein [Alteribacillus sp. YIM 98480]|uniref:hypothetical protein n=1 Tax=Alteribacillus sp. YIM 98480 TaxID=2606599 RepID=UPI00131E4F7C|nr:hypothetical protein [Alteribacillus sp. YIM 98480]
MNTSPITSWEGAEAYFTFGPGSLGIAVSFLAAISLFVLFISTMVRHENRSFAEVSEIFPAMEREAAQEWKPETAPTSSVASSYAKSLLVSEEKTQIL